MRDRNCTTNCRTKTQGISSMSSSKSTVLSSQLPISRREGHGKETDHLLGLDRQPEEVTQGDEEGQILEAQEPTILR